MATVRRMKSPQRLSNQLFKLQVPLNKRHLGITNSEVFEVSRLPYLNYSLKISLLASDYRFFLPKFERKLLPQDYSFPQFFNLLMGYHELVY